MKKATDPGAFEILVILVLVNVPKVELVNERLLPTAVSKLIDPKSCVGRPVKSPVPVVEVKSPNVKVVAVLILPVPADGDPMSANPSVPLITFAWMTPDDSASSADAKSAR